MESPRLLVAEAPRFDLEQYIANYKGKTRLYRLLHIGKHSAYLSTDALKAAALEAKTGKDVALYEKIVQTLQSVAPNEQEAVLDKDWVDKTTREVKAETTRMELELKGYKHNLIKESIRMGYDDIGRHYHEIGDLAEAAKAFSRERDYCQNSAHVSVMNFRLVHVYIDQQSWLSVESGVQKLRSLHKPSDTERSSSSTSTITESEKMSAKLSAAQGLAHMANKNYHAAALAFLECHPCMLQAKLDDPTDELAYNEVLTPNDVATYGALCALATFDRAQLQARVLDNARFRAYLELEPHLRRAVAGFVGLKFADCLAALHAHRADYLLDPHLAPHYADLVARVRSTALVLHCAAFSRVALADMAAAFRTDVAALTPELVRLVAAGGLDARLDLERGVLEKNRVDRRRAVYREAVRAAEDYEAALHQKMYRVAVVNAGLEVKPPKGHAEGRGNAVPLGGDLMGMDGGGSRRSLRAGWGMFS